MRLRLSVGDLADQAHDEATFAACALHALAREESRGRRPKRLLEPGLATWQQFRGHLDEHDLVQLLLEDAAVTQPDAFTPPPGLDPALAARVPLELWRAWLDEVSTQGPESVAAPESPDDAQEYIASQAKRLDLPTRMARSNLHKLQPHQRALELPGSGGQLAYYITSRQPDIHLRNVFTIACRDWRDYTLAALITVEVGITGPAPALIDPELARARKQAREQAFDYVLGLDPEKGGAFNHQELTGLFPNATILLV